MQQGVQTDATCNIQQCWELLSNKVAPIGTGFSNNRIRGRSRDDVVEILFLVFYFGSTIRFLLKL